MTNIWQTVQLGKVMQVEIDAVPVDNQPEFHMAGVYSFARGLFKREPLPNTQTTYKVFHRLHKDMFVISVPKGWEGALARVTDDFDGMFLSPVYPTFRANPKELDIRYFEWYCRQSKVWDELRRKSRGIGARRESISAEQFLTLEIPLPPLIEQHRIVAHIESLAARVNEAQRLREEADTETDLLFSKATKEIFAKHLDKVTKIGDEFRVTTGGTPSRSNPSYWEGDVRWVSSGEVAFNRIYDTREKITEVGVSESNAKVYPPKTVLIAMIGQGKTRGQCAVLECHAATNQNVAGIHVYETSHIPEYVYWWLRSRYLESRVSEIGTAQPALSGERVKQMPIPLPPLDEQRRIVAYLDGLQAKVNVLRGLQSQSQEELDALLPSVLDKAFKGEL